MSTVLWIIEEGLEGDWSNRDLWGLLHFQKELDEICDNGGVCKLTTFHDLSVLASQFDETMEPALSNASELLVSLTKVRDVVIAKGPPFPSDGVERISEVRDDLNEAIRVASDCEARGKRVRLSIIP